MKRVRMNTMIALFAGLFVLAATTAITANSSGTKAGNEDPTVTNDGPKDECVIDKFAKVKGAIKFNHKKHTELAGECATCHHKEKDGKKEVSCFECHQKKEEGGVPSAKSAFHDKCAGCHSEKVAADPTLKGKAPEKTKDECNLCHNVAK